MAHSHHCKVCNVVTAMCDGPCVQEEDHYCSLHTPDPALRHNPAPVPRMNVRIVDEATPTQSEK